MGVKSEKGASLISLFLKYVLLSLCIVSVVTFWGEDKWNPPEDGRGTDASRVIMTSREAAQGLLQLWAHQWSRSHHRDVLWALLYLDSPVHTAPRWTQPIWAGHCTQEDLGRSTCPFTSTSTHTAAHHAYSDATTNIYPTTIKTLIFCHASCISSPWGYVQLVYTYLEICVNTGKCTTINVNVILSSIKFSILYITHSHIFRCGLLRS